jgi:DNA ligase-4
MFFATPGRHDEVASNVDQSGDSYARTTTSEELSDVLKQMTKKNRFDISQCPEPVAKLIERIQERVNSGHEMPCGLLFTSLTILFPHKNEDVSESESMIPSDAHSRLRYALNVARFAGANIAKTSSHPSITHVVVDPESSSTEISSLRGEWSRKSGKKVPHIVTVDWVEESWKSRTLLDEERFQPKR